MYSGVERSLKNLLRRKKVKNEFQAEKTVKEVGKKYNVYGEVQKVQYQQNVNAKDQNVETKNTEIGYDVSHKPGF